MGEADRPAGNPQDGAVRATQFYEVVAEQREWKLRPNRVTVVPQTWGASRGAWAHSGQGPHRTRYGGVPTSEPVSGEQGSTPRPAHAAGRRLSLRGDHRESEAQSFRSDPWAAVRRAGLDPMQPVPDSGDGNPPGFSAGNAGKSQKLTRLSPERTSEGKASEGAIDPPHPNCLLQCDRALALI